MAGAPQHNKHMENLMRTEIFMLCIKDGKLEGVNHSADGVDDTSGQKPALGSA